MTITQRYERSDALPMGERSRVGDVPDGIGNQGRTLRRSMAFGAMGALAMAALYLGLVSVAESWQHAQDLFREDATLVIPIILGFGTQIGLFTYLRALTRLKGGPAGAVAGASGGTSTLGMVACCAHHLTDVLPLVGLSGATIFLAEYKQLFMIGGLVSNLVALVVLSFLVYRTHRDYITMRCHS